ncbi:GBS Bsp-like repeat-containing protein, partial [Enterococcus sp. 5H]|uniref:GBS Bsp-like repeat-containing protein n=1 Tax=Enterococcus sp. 5H TaxID=1229490 RepID=UPI002302D6B3
MKKKILLSVSLCTCLVFSNLFPVFQVKAESVKASESTSPSLNLPQTTVEKNIEPSLETNETTTSEINQSTDTTEQTRSTDNETEDSNLSEENDNYYEPSTGSRSDLNTLPSLGSRMTRNTVDIVNAGESNRPAAHFIDISSHNETISVNQFQMMKTYGITGVVVKLTEGTTYFNPYAKSQIDNAKLAGMTVSVYHYSHYTSAAGAELEAAYFASKANELGLSKTTVMVSDIEESPMNISSLNTNTSTFKTKLNSLGYTRIAYYMSRSWLDVAGGRFNTSLFGKENIWVAQYPYTPTASQNWNNDYSAWQWSSNFYFPGIAHPFDINTDYTGLFTGDSGWTSDIPVKGSTKITDKSGNETIFEATTTIEAGGYSPIEVYFATWSEENGQDDLVWYPAKRNGDGTWTASINIANHATAGKYIVHTYAKMNKSTQVGASSDTFNVTQPSLDARATAYNNATNSFDVIVTPTTVSGVKEVRIPVWSKADRSDLIWYRATRQADGTYKATVNIKDHQYNTGNYTVHVYLYSNNGLVNGMVANPVDVSWSLGGKTTIEDTNGKETTYKATTTVNQGNYQGAMTVHVAVWSSNDLKWYVATKNSNGTYQTTININNHKNSGKYFADTYVKLSNGTMQCISSDTFNVTQPGLDARATAYNNATNSFDVIVTPTTVSGVKEVR